MVFSFKIKAVIALAAIVVFVVHTFVAYDKGVKDERGNQELKLANAQLEAKDAAEKKQKELNEKIEKLTQEARENEKKYNDDISAAADAYDSLHKQAELYAARADKLAAAAKRGNSGSPCALLAKLFAEADERAGELAETADRAIDAGGYCVRMYDDAKNQR